MPQNRLPWRVDAKDPFVESVLMPAYQAARGQARRTDPKGWSAADMEAAYRKLENDLGTDPYALSQGEVGPDDFGITYEGPFLVLFQVNPADLIVTVIDVRLRPPPSYFPAAPPQVVAGVRIVNVTPHNLLFETEDEQVLNVPPTGFLVGATVEREIVRHAKGVDLVGVRFRPTSEGSRQQDALEREFPDAVVVGSTVAARAYPGRGIVPVPLPGFERVRMADRRHRIDRFETLE